MCTKAHSTKSECCNNFMSCHPLMSYFSCQFPTNQPLTIILRLSIWMFIFLEWSKLYCGLQSILFLWKFLVFRLCLNISEYIWMHFYVFWQGVIMMQLNSCGLFYHYILMHWNVVETQHFRFYGIIFWVRQSSYKLVLRIFSMWWWWNKPLDLQHTLSAEDRNLR